MCSYCKVFWNKNSVSGQWEETVKPLSKPGTALFMALISGAQSLLQTGFSLTVFWFSFSFFVQVNGTEADYEYEEITLERVRNSFKNTHNTNTSLIHPSINLVALPLDSFGNIIVLKIISKLYGILYIIHLRVSFVSKRDYLQFLIIIILDMLKVQGQFSLGSVYPLGSCRNRIKK